MSILLKTKGMLKRESSYHFPIWAFREKYPSIMNIIIKRIESSGFEKEKEWIECQAWQEAGFDIQMRIKKEGIMFTVVDIRKKVNNRIDFILTYEELKKIKKQRSKEYNKFILELLN